MGIFGSSTKTTVGTSVARVIEDSMLPNAMLEGQAQNQLDDGEQLVEQVMESLTSCIGTRANRMYNYGRDGYIYGTPSGSVHSSFAAKEASAAVLASLTGGPVTIAYYHFGPLNKLHIGWKKLTEEYGYNPATNVIAGLSSPTKQVFLKDMRVIVTHATLEEASNGSLDQWGTPPNAGPTPERQYQTSAAGSLVGATPFMVDPTASADYILVDTCWTEQEPVVPGSTVMKDVVKFGTVTLALTGYDMAADWHQAKYVTQVGATGYWVYQHGTAGHPEIDAVFDTAYSGAGHFFPWAYFRYNKLPQNTDIHSEGYKSSKKLLNTINMGFDHLVDSIHQNPDIGDVEQAMMVMAVPADTTNHLELRYLFDFFTGLYDQQVAQGHSNATSNNMADGILRGLGVPVNRTSMIIQDKRFKMSLNWKNITRRKVAGSIGDVGTYAGGANSIPSSVSVPSLSGDPVTWDTTNKRHWYQHQVAKGVYEEVQIFDLKLTYFIFEQYTTTGDEDDEILLIPVDISIAMAYTIPEREVLYSRALHYVFNSRVVTKLKWYQTGIFKNILLAVAIVVTVITYGTTWESIAAALAAGTITMSAILIAMLQQVVKYLLMTVALKFFVRELGVKFAFLVAIVAAVTGTYQSIGADSVQGAPWANELLAVSSGLTKAISQDMQDDFNDLLNQQSDLQKYIKQQTKLLDDTKELLNYDQRLAPLVIFGEKPSDFYQRTVHSGNIGAIGLDAVTSFVDAALTLPKLSDTLT